MLFLFLFIILLLPASFFLIFSLFSSLFVWFDFHLSFFVLWAVSLVPDAMLSGAGKVQFEGFFFHPFFFLIFDFYIHWFSQKKFNQRHSTIHQIKRDNSWYETVHSSLVSVCIIEQIASPRQWEMESFASIPPLASPCLPFPTFSHDWFKCRGGGGGGGHRVALPHCGTSHQIISP